MTSSHDLRMLHAIMAQHENDIQSSQMPLPGHTFTAIEHVLWHYIITLQGQESYLLEKMAPPHYRLRLILHPSPTWRAIQLALERESQQLIQAGFLAVAHHGVKECFGCWVQQEAGSSHREPTQILWRSLRHPIDYRSRLLWRGLRWLCANLLLWKRPQLIFPGDLDHLDTLLMP